MILPLSLQSENAPCIPRRDNGGPYHAYADNPTITKSVLESQGLAITEADVVQAKLPHRPGELARAASRLGEADININYAYGGLEAGTNATVVIFGVAEVGKAVAILDQVAAAAAGT